MRDARFVGIDRQLEPLQSLGRRLKRGLGFRFLGAQNHPIVGIAHQCQPGLRQRHVELVQVHVRQQRREHAALKCARARIAPAQVIEHLRLEPARHQPQDAAVLHLAGDQGQQHPVVEIFKTILDIAIHDPSPPPVAPLNNRVRRVQSRAPFTKTETAIQEPGFIQRRDGVINGALNDAVPDGKNRQRSLAAAGLGHPHPAHRLWAIHAGAQRPLQRIQVGLQVGLELAQAFAIHARPAAICLHLAPRSPQAVLGPDARGQFRLARGVFRFPCAYQTRHDFAHRVAPFQT